MKLLKWLGGLFVGTVLLLIIGIVVISWVINPNDYKPHLQTLVHAETGRTLQLEGDIEWSLFPWLGVTLGRVTLSNADQFSQPYFATIEQAEVRLQVLPLLRRALTVDTVQLTGANIWLARNAEGQTNWDDLAALGQKGQKTEPSQDSGGLPFTELSVQGVVLKAAYIQWDDALNQTHYRVSELDLTSGRIQYPIADSIPLKVTGKMESVAASPLQAEFALNTALDFAIPAQQYRLQATQFAVTLKHQQLPQGQQRLQLNSPLLQADLSSDTLHISPLTLRFGEQLALTTDLKVTQLSTDPTLTGQLALQELNPRQMLAEWAMALPTTLPEPALSRAAFSTELNANAQKGVFLTNTRLSLDEAVLQVPMLNLELASQTLKVETWSLSGAGLQGQGRFALTKLFSEQPQVNAQLDISAALAELPPYLTALLPPRLAVKQAQVQLTVDGASENLHLSELRLQLDQHHLTVAGATLQPQMAGVSVQNVQVQAFGVSAAASLTVEPDAAGKGGLHGSLEIAPFNLRTLAETFALPLPEMQDANTLTQVALKTRFGGHAKAPTLSQLRLVCDDSVLTGTVTLPSLSPPNVQFALILDQLNLDRYLPPKSATPAEPPPVADAPPLPVEWLQQLALDGRLTIGQLTAAGANMQDLALTIKAQDGAISLNNQLNLYSGQLSGQVDLQANQTPPRLTIVEQLEHVALEPLLQDVTQTAVLAGQSNAHINLTGQFTTMTQLLKTLNGTVALDLTDGAINGFNLGRSLRQAKALIKGEEPPPPEPLKSDFSSLQMVFKARNGILHTEQLTMESPLLRVQGSGHIDLPAQKMDLRLETMVVNTSTGQAGKELAELSGIGIPILLTGALQQPTVKPDLTVLVSLGSFGLQALKERLGPGKPAADPSSEADSENKNEILEGIGKRLGEGLRSLF